MKNYRIKGKIHIFPMEVSWYYMPVPLSKVPNVPKRGWGSVPIMATVGKTTWRTSIFPIKKDHYFIPLKKKVRKTEDLHEGDTISMSYQVAKE